MTNRKKRWLVLGGSVAAAVVVLLVAAVLVAQSQWFDTYVKDKVVATIEESTGGRAEIGSFSFDPWHLTVRIRNFVLHGNEPASADPLARISLLELRLKLFAGLKKTVDLAYLGVTEPRVNLIVNPDGSTNIPAPRVKQQPSDTSGLETVVNLAIGQFTIDKGLLVYAQRASQFSARGEDLQALLSYNNFTSSYEGRLLINPLLLATGSGTPLPVQVMLPLLLEKDAVSISGGRLATGSSQILINAGLRDLNSPVITARVNADVSVAEMQKSLDLPIDTNARDAPKTLTAELTAKYDDKSSSIEIQAAHLALGQSNFEAAGTVQAGGNKAVQFNAKLALDQLSRLAKLGTTKLSGALMLHGHATEDAQKNFAVDGTVNSQGLGIRSGTTSLADVRLTSPFHADPFLVSLDGLRLHVLGGDLAAKVFVEKMQQLSVEGHLSSFSIPLLARTFSGHALGYGGSISGSINAKSNLKAPGTSGVTAQTRLVISPGGPGIPLSGRIDGRYNGASRVVDLEQSYVAMPNSRLDLNGDINKQLNVALVSHNLNDFLPAANFGAAQPMASLPVTLQGGSASLTAQIQGNLSAPNISAHAAVDRFAVEGSLFQHAALDLSASPSGAALSNGVLTSDGLRSTFGASIGLFKWKPLASSPLSANLNVPNGNLTNVLALAGEQDLPASGRVNVAVQVRGTYGDPLGSASLQILHGVAYNQPFDKVQANVDLAHELITLTTLEVDAAGGQLLAHGTFRHPSDSFQVGHAEFHVKSSDIQLANLKPLQQQSPGTAGVLKLSADGAGDLRKAATGSEFQVSNIGADFSATGLQVNHQSAGDLSAQAHTTNGVVAYNVHSNFAGSAIQADGSTSLAKGYVTNATASIQNLSVEKTLAITGQATVPASGTVSLNAKVSGTLANPNALVDLALSKAVIYNEPVNLFTAKLQYSNTQIDLQSLNLDVPAGTLSASANYTHKDGDLNSGHVQAHVNSSDIDLSKIEHLATAAPGLAGGLKLMADVAGDMRQRNGKPELLLSEANADVDAHSLRANGHDLGQLRATAKTEQRVVKFDLQSNLAQTNLKASGQTQLKGDYPTHAQLTFGNIRYANIAPFFSTDNSVKPAFDALVDGEASVDGPVLNMDALAGRLQLNQLQVRTLSSGSVTGAGNRTVELQNEGPAILTLNHSVLRVQQLKIRGGGGKTFLEAGGSLSLKDADNALGLTLKGNADLGMLQGADRDFYSSGSVLLDATIRGSLASPLVNGEIDLKDANLNYANAQNGLSNGNGVILFNGTTATIQKLTGESGGGKISVTGFAGLSPTQPIFNLHATANRVRTRYAGISLTSSANIILAGGAHHSTLDGTVTIQRIAYSTSSDAGSILSSASVPPSSPSAPSALLSGMRLDVRIVTAPDLQVVTTYAEKLSLTSNLTLTGTAQDPGMVGHLSVTNGELVFFGNTYTVNTGSISFYNINSIQPILNLSLETTAQGVDVTLGVTGPVNDLKLSYRSDPPLSFEQIVELLATNTTPSDPTIASQQPTPPQQSMSQMGESAVLGQAVANPLASRVQRVFGLTQFKIDPSISGSNGQPSARITLQQKITSNVTFTYINDVTQANSEIIRVQYDITPKLSAVALRDYNGNVSLEFFYKFQAR
jgi:translocation and assembly module TamB